MTLVLPPCLPSIPRIRRPLTTRSSHCWCRPCWTDAFDLFGKMGLQD